MVCDGCNRLGNRNKNWNICSTLRSHFVLHCPHDDLPPFTNHMLFHQPLATNHQSLSSGSLPASRQKYHLLSRGGRHPSSRQSRHIPAEATNTPASHVENPGGWLPSSRVTSGGSFALPDTQPHPSSLLHSVLCTLYSALSSLSTFPYNATSLASSASQVSAARARRAFAR